MPVSKLRTRRPKRVPPTTEEKIAKIRRQIQSIRDRHAGYQRIIEEYIIHRDNHLAAVVTLEAELDFLLSQEAAR
ncbi:hypothetical protein FHS85_001870 [Rhodoligotrophos appendicifer]